MQGLMDHFSELLAQQANIIVMGVLENAKRQLQDLQLEAESREETDEQPSFQISNIEWVTNRDFTVAIGAKQIEEYISTWEFSNCWLHCLDYLKEEELEYRIQHHYRVRWSIPTRRKPIPRATASTYFIIEISKVKPPIFPVEVYFFFESNRLLHRPGKTRFREKWLKDIIESKIILMEQVTF
ncbi:A-kinase anchor protein 14 isoform X1 [Chiloscyllium plagiosum]|uniref:A-kinase anchor protein 14 isoform X1 n=2 Tax=Chiloscyllium plagiosum TaxID=36176 RepID=UPI001CB7FC05|nr:A-kinase anchor protein 14 isoform X1 [Chiloscyllium plagiosum]